MDLYSAIHSAIRRALCEHQKDIYDKNGSLKYSYKGEAKPHKVIDDFKPAKVIKAYKAFKMKLSKDGKNLTPGKLYPLYVNTETSEFEKGKSYNGLELNKWYKSGSGEVWISQKNGQLYTFGKGYNVSSNTLDALSYRPGWHLTATPWGNQRGQNKVSDGPKGTGNNFRNTWSDEVWCEVEISASNDVTQKAIDLAPKDKNGKYNPIDACLQELDDDTFYRYKTNTNASDDQTWYIADMIKITKVLTDDEVDELNDQFFSNLSMKTGRKINSDPQTYTKSSDDIPYWKMPRSNGKRYSQNDLNDMDY